MAWRLPCAGWLGLGCRRGAREEAWTLPGQRAPSPGGFITVGAASLTGSHPLCRVFPEKPTEPWGCSALEGGGHLSSQCLRLIWKVLDTASIFLRTPPPLPGAPAWWFCCCVLGAGRVEAVDGARPLRLGSPNLPGASKQLCGPPAAVPTPGWGSVFTQCPGD